MVVVVWVEGVDRELQLVELRVVVVEAGESGSGGSSGGGEGVEGVEGRSSSSRLLIRSSKDGRALSRGLPNPNIRYAKRII